jgi:hypothetical protein
MGRKIVLMLAAFDVCTGMGAGSVAAGGAVATRGAADATAGCTCVAGVAAGKAIE